eukprot:SAG11_NODE_140_length_15009_cov_7.342522_11_plen_82_part_00
MTLPFTSRDALRLRYWHHGDRPMGINASVAHRLIDLDYVEVLLHHRGFGVSEEPHQLTGAWHLHQKAIVSLQSDPARTIGV